VQQGIGGSIPDLCFQLTTIMVLQEATKAYLVGVFEDANLLCHSCQARYHMNKDIQLAMQVT
jgi:histone H3